MSYDKFSVGVLFENSIVCHVFYAMALGAAHDFGCVWFLGFVLFWFAWSSFLLLWGLGWAWSGFLDCCTDFGFWLTACLWLVGAWFCWFCLESLILAQDERWRRA